jgi:hypothetical protein
VDTNSITEPLIDLELNQMGRQNALGSLNDYFEDNLDDYNEYKWSSSRPYGQRQSTVIVRSSEHGENVFKIPPPGLSARNEFKLPTNPPIKVTIEPTDCGSLSSRANSQCRHQHHAQVRSSRHMSTSPMPRAPGRLSRPSIDSILLRPGGGACQNNIIDCECEHCMAIKEFANVGFEPCTPNVDDQSEDLAAAAAGLGEPRAAYSYIKSYFVSMLQPSDNKLAMKLFGSKKGVLKEKIRQQEVGHWIIHPCSNFR